MTHAASVIVVALTVLVTACSDGARPTGSAAAPAGGVADDAVATEIRRLEQLEVQAVLASDATTLAGLWDANYVVNNPDNQIVVATSDPRDRPVLQRPRSAFTREVEHITVQGDIAISMGSETVVPAGDRPQAGELIKRRYTNVWRQTSGAWKLLARHANVIRETR